MDQKVFYNEKVTIKEEYELQINSGNQINAKQYCGKIDKAVTIIFVNKKLDSVYDDHVSNFDIRSQWHIRKGIADKILEIEKSYEVKL